MIQMVVCLLVLLTCVFVLGIMLYRSSRNRGIKNEYKIKYVVYLEEKTGDGARRQYSRQDRESIIFAENIKDAENKLKNAVKERFSINICVNDI